LGKGGKGMLEFNVDKITIPLKQHVGGPCQPIVSVGDHVKRGQLVATPNGLGANIHTSLSGVVESVDEMNIVVKLDKEQSDDYVKLEPTDDHLQRIKDAGIVGVGGAGFPTGIKLSAQIPGGYVIANAAECEPVLGHNVRYMEEHPEELVRGLKYILKLTGAKEGYIAIKTKYRKALLALGKACKDEPNISIKILPNMYPAGDERVIVRETLGVVLKPGQLPLEANAIISNVETIKRIVEAIELDKPARYNGKDLPSLRQIAQECIDASLALPEIPSVVHGDLCFSNVMYDSRSNSVKVIDPRGLNIQQELTIYGNQSYDLAKLCHSFIGLYDFIIADAFHLEKNDEIGVKLRFNLDSRLKQVQSMFMQKSLIPELSNKAIIAPTILLFLSMIPLHFDKPHRQEAMLANALRLYVEYFKA